MAKKPTNKTAVKKSTPKKEIKVTAKKQIKNSKPAAKATPKKVVKPVAKKIVVKATPKKVVKPIAKKVAAKKIAKPIAKKVITKATPKKTGKPVAKKVVAKVVPKKVVAKAVPKKIKKTPAPKVKVVAQKPVKIEKVKVEKPVKIKVAKAVKIAKKVLLPTPEAPSEVVEKPSKIPAKYKKLEMEFPIHASRLFLYNMFSTAAGLSEWFADNVNIRGNFFTFIWDGSEQTAELKAYKEGTYVRFRWLDSPDIYFEFRIETDDLTGDVALIVTDFAEDSSSEQSTKLLWNSQIENLMRVIGA